MKTEKKQTILKMLSVFLVCGYAFAGQTTYLEAADGPYASNLYPADGAGIPGEVYPDVPPYTHIWTMLIFEPGSTAVKHTGYFSDDYSKVYNRHQDANLGQPPYPYPGWDNRYFVGNPEVPPATDSLVRGTTYYWCVDETDGNNVVWQGPVWSFYVQSYYATRPDPPNEAVYVNTDVLLSWRPGYQVDVHDVYIGTSFDPVFNADEFDITGIYQGWTIEPNWPCSGLPTDTKIYWRVDEVHSRIFPGSGTIYKGDVWCFTTRPAVLGLFVDIDAAGANNGTSWADAFNHLQDALSIAWPGDEIYVAQGTYKPDLGTGVTPGDRNATFQLIGGIAVRGGYAGFGEPDPNDRDIELYETILSGDLLGNDIDVNDPRDLLYEHTRVDNSYHVLTGSGIDESAILDGFTIIAGHAKDRYGGGMYNYNGSPTVLNCTFTKNWAEENGGGMFNSGGNPLLVNCKFTFNATSEDDDDEGGSGIFNGGGSSTILVDCVFIGNWADFRGGGMYNKYSYPTLTNCTFSKNWAEMGGAIYNYRDTDEEDYSPTFTNCTFSGNSADDGGAMYNRKSSTTLTNCTFSGNLADNNGGGMYNYYSNPTVTNCIFWGNIDSGGVDESAQIHNYSGAIPAINYCCVQGWTSVLGGTGNIDADPLFVDADGIDNIVGTEDDNLRLLLGSPCINAGDNSVVTVPTDLDGNPRIRGGAVDMGAYEACTIYHVDGVNGDNTNDGLTPETAFKTIQRGINVAEDCEAVLVWPGVYNEEISFWGDAITVQSCADAAVVETDYGYAFSLFSAEGPNTVLSNFVIRNSQYGIYLINGSSPTLRNLTIVNNDFGISAFNGSDPDISNCILWGNNYGDLFREPVPLQARYSWIEDEQADPNLVAYWKLDGDATDSAGSNHGTIYGATPASGQVGGALSFDGDDYIQVADDDSLDISNKITISAWINPSNTSSIRIIVSKYKDYAGESYLLELKYEKIYFVLAGISSLSGVQTYSTGIWYHVAATYDGSRMRVYTNGELDNDLDVTGTIPITTQELNIGRQADNNFWPFEGLIDDVRIYDRGLSSEEIKALYNTGLAGHGYGPLFADANNDDYHLLSERGRYWPAHDVWVLDDVISPCIDGGDPNVNPSNEPMPNGGRINMGAYGNTAYASMSEWPIKGDINRDGRFNFVDIAILLDEWLAELPWVE